MFANTSAVENITREAEVNDFEPDIVGDFLNFLYTGELVDPALYNSLDLLLLADKYNVVALRKECEKALVKSIRCKFHQHFTSAFCMKVLCAAFLLLQFGFVIFWRKNIGAKAACKIVMKLTTVLQM